MGACRYLVELARILSQGQHWFITLVEESTPDRDRKQEKQPHPTPGVGDGAKKGVNCMRSGSRRHQGQGLVEYALIIALVAIVVIAILVLMGPQIGDIFSTITHGL